MRVQILRDGQYSRFNIPGYRHRVGKQQLAAGDVIDFPDWYAKSIVDDGLAEHWVAPDVPTVQAVDATSAAFKLAAELDVDLFTVTGSGADGRITAGDVKKAAR